jgi:hypothetical protein
MSYIYLNLYIDFNLSKNNLYSLLIFLKSEILIITPFCTVGSESNQPRGNIRPATNWRRQMGPPPRPRFPAPLLLNRFRRCTAGKPRGSHRRRRPRVAAPPLVLLAFSATRVLSLHRAPQLCPRAHPRAAVEPVRPPLHA